MNTVYLHCVVKVISGEISTHTNATLEGQTGVLEFWIDYSTHTEIGGQQQKRFLLTQHYVPSVIQ